MVKREINYILVQETYTNIEVLNLITKIIDDVQLEKNTKYNISIE